MSSVAAAAAPSELIADTVTSFELKLHGGTIMSHVLMCNVPDHAQQTITLMKFRLHSLVRAPTISRFVTSANSKTC